jgi:hypothetical protein
LPKTIHHFCDRNLPLPNIACSAYRLGKRFIAVYRMWTRKNEILCCAPCHGVPTPRQRDHNDHSSTTMLKLSHNKRVCQTSRTCNNMAASLATLRRKVLVSSELHQWK